MSNDFKTSYPRVGTYQSGTVEAPKMLIEIDWRSGGTHVLDLPTAIRLRDRLSEAIAAAQDQSPTEPASHASPCAGA